MAAGTSGARLESDEDDDDEKGDSGEETAGGETAISLTSQAVREMRKLAVVVDGSDRWREAVSMRDCTAARDDGDVDSDRSNARAAVCPSASASRSVSLWAVSSNVDESAAAARLWLWLLLPLLALLMDVAGEPALPAPDDAKAEAPTGD